MRRLSYTQLVIIDFYRGYTRSELSQYLKENSRYIDDETLRRDAEALAGILEESTDAAYMLWQKEALGMDDTDAEEWETAEEE